jgi:hypothetical protein
MISYLAKPVATDLEKLAIVFLQFSGTLVPDAITGAHIKF